MAARYGKKALILSVCVAALAVGGCGGGGGSDGPGTPPPISAPPPPPPPPTPPPPPAGVNYNDAEYQRSNGAAAHGAITAYNAGATGQNIKVAVIDTGINPNLSQFAGKIDPASRDIASNRGVTDTEGHGTAVSGVIAARRDGTDILGVAFGSTIVSLNTSDPDDCTEEDGCQHSDGDIADALDVARTAGAKVVNISLGGGAPGSYLLSAMNRATAAGIVVVISSGNDGESEADPFASVSAQQAGRGLVIIAGAHDANRQMASFSNRAGEAAAYYLTAVGERVRSFDQTGTPYLYSGTSFSAPVISGAAALLASAFPNLTGAQIVQLLFSTADDAGAAGDDPVFGNGILNITRAFAPQGTLTLAGSAVAVAPDDSGQGSAPMGDFKPAMLGAIVLDGYSRAYAVDLARSLQSAPAERPLAMALAGSERSFGAAAGKVALSVTMDRRLSGQPHVGLAQAGLTHEDARQARIIAGSALARLTPDTAVAFGFSESGRALAQRLTGHEGSAFLVARDPLARSGFYAVGANSFGMRHDLGPIGLTVTAESGEVYNPGLRRTLGEPGYNVASLGFDRTFGPVDLSLTASRLEEERTVLGARFGSAFAGGGATSHFLDASLGGELGSGWSATATYRRGWTALAGTGALVQGGMLSSDAFSFDLGRRDSFAPGDRFALRIMQPLRVGGGGFDLLLPTSYNYADGMVGYEKTLFELTPSGREIDFEAAYAIGLLAGDLSANAFLRRQPGHVASAADDVGGAIRFTLGF